MRSMKEFCQNIISLYMELFDFGRSFNIFEISLTCVAVPKNIDSLIEIFIFGSIILR